MRPELQARLADFNETNVRMRETLSRMPSVDRPSDWDFLEALDALTREADDCPNIWATTWDLRDALGIDEALIQRQAANLLHRDIICGCDCGCRGDWSLDNEGLDERLAVDEYLAGAYLRT